MNLNIGAGAVNSLLVADPYAIRDYAQAAEGLGFDFVTLIDHVVTGYPEVDGTPRFHYPPRTPYQDILVTLGYLAGVTERIRLRTAVVILPLRNPILVAKQIAAADAFSAGRVDLGLGIGSHDLEYDALGVPWSERGKRLDEGIEIARLLWTQERVDHKGRFHHLDGMAMEPKPVQKPHPPLWFGGTSRQNHRRVARWGAGWISRPVQTRQEIAGSWSQIRRLAADLGRDPDTIRFQTTVPLGPRRTTDDVLEDLWAMISLGATDVVFFTSYAEGVDTIADHITQLRRVHDEILTSVAR